jgi:hypothetical protein
VFLVESRWYNRSTAESRTRPSKFISQILNSNTTYSLNHAMSNILGTTHQPARRKNPWVLGSLHDMHHHRVKTIERSSLFRCFLMGCMAPSKIIKPKNWQYDIYIYIYQYHGFHKWGYSQIIQFNRIFMDFPL